eukprot:COSAG04_NODE_800_length_10199_cov_36.147327_2_plen_174_part_00
MGGGAGAGCVARHSIAERTERSGGGEPAGRSLRNSMAQPRAGACFCLSKAREDTVTESGEAKGTRKLRSELEGLKLSELMRRAKASGATAAELEQACDADDPEAAVIALILVHEVPSAGGGGAAAALRDSLASLKTSQLRKRCVVAGAAIAVQLLYGCIALPYLTSHSHLEVG